MSLRPKPNDGGEASGKQQQKKKKDPVVEWAKKHYCGPGRMKIISYVANSDVPLGGSTTLVATAIVENGVICIYRDEIAEAASMLAKYVAGMLNKIANVAEDLLHRYGLKIDVPRVAEETVAEIAKNVLNTVFTTLKIDKVPIIPLPGITVGLVEGPVGVALREASFYVAGPLASVETLITIGGLGGAIEPGVRTAKMALFGIPGDRIVARVNVEFPSKKGYYVLEVGTIHLETGYMVGAPRTHVVSVGIPWWETNWPILLVGGATLAGGALLYKYRESVRRGGRRAKSWIETNWPILVAGGTLAGFTALSILRELGRKRQE